MMAVNKRDAQWLVRTQRLRNHSWKRPMLDADVAEMNQTIFILTGTSSEYTAARQHLNLTPRQAYWLTGASQLKGFSSPTVYRIGSWRTLARIEAINVAMAEAEAEIIDL